MYNPFSVNALGMYLFLFDIFVVENFDRKTCSSSSVSLKDAK
jgi:hypothetical protein